MVFVEVFVVIIVVVVVVVEVYILRKICCGDDLLYLKYGLFFVFRGEVLVLMVVVK